MQPMERIQRVGSSSVMVSILDHAGREASQGKACSKLEGVGEIEFRPCLPRVDTEIFPELTRTRER